MQKKNDEINNYQKPVRTRVKIEKTKKTNFWSVLWKVTLPFVIAFLIDVIANFSADYLKNLNFPFKSLIDYLPSMTLGGFALFLGIYCITQWEILKANILSIPSYCVWAIALLASLLLCFYLLPEKELEPPISKVVDFWRPFINDAGTKIVTGTPLLWTGPHNPVYGSIALEINKPYGHKIAIYNGEYFFSNDSSVIFKNTNYMLARMSFTSWFDFQTAYEIRELLKPETSVDIVSAGITDSGFLNANLILIGGPSANRTVSEVLTKLIIEHGLEFSFNFLIRKLDDPSQDIPPLIQIAKDDKIGIVNILKMSSLLVEYKPEKLDRFSEPGSDGAIVIKTFNPYYPDKSILIIAGFEEHGSLAAIEVLRHNSSHMKLMNKYYEEYRAVEIVIKTSVSNNKPSGQKIDNSNIRPVMRKISRQ